MRTSTILGSLAIAATSLAAQSHFNPADPGFAASTVGGVKVFQIGPVNVPAGSVVNSKIYPGEYESVVAAPHPGDVFMTGFNTRVTDVNRVPQDPLEIYLHHAVMLKSGARDLTCAYLGARERFAAAGAERIPLMLPPGYGYRIRANESVSCILHLQNYTLTAKTVYLQYSMTVVPGTTTLKEVRPWWLDVVPCTSSYVVPSGTGKHTKSSTGDSIFPYKVPANMSLLTMGPHLHCYGDKLELWNATTNTLIHTFLNRRACEVDMLAVLNEPALKFTQGDLIRLTAVYDMQASAPIDAMGIMLGYVVYD